MPPVNVITVAELVKMLAEVPQDAVIDFTGKYWDHEPAEHVRVTANPPSEGQPRRVEIRF